MVESCRGLVLRPCYTVQFSQQLVSQCVLGTKNKKTVCTCPLIKKCKIETSCWRGDTLCNGVVNCCNPLQKVELSSTSCNTSCNKKIARQTMLHCAILQQLVSQWHCDRQVAEKIVQCNRALSRPLFLAAK